MARALLPLLVLGLVMGTMLGFLLLRASWDPRPELVIGARHTLHGEIVVCEDEPDARRFAVAGWDRGGGTEAPGCGRQDGLEGFVPFRRLAGAFRPRIAAQANPAERSCVEALTGAEIPCFDPGRKDSFFEGVVPSPGGPRRIFVALDTRTRLVTR